MLITMIESYVDMPESGGSRVESVRYRHLNKILCSLLHT